MLKIKSSKQMKSIPDGNKHTQKEKLYLKMTLNMLATRANIKTHIKF